VQRLSRIDIFTILKSQIIAIDIQVNLGRI
jgi:hypothetical protein